MKIPSRLTVLIPAVAVVASLGCVSLAQDAPKVLRLEENLAYGELLVLGAEENVRLQEYDVTWKARIDTGATTTSVHALDVAPFERDGKSWVRFVMRNDAEDVMIEAEKPVSRYVLIRKRGDDGHHRRAVVEMDVVIGEVERRIEVNLSDRTGFDFPILIGRNYLSGTAIVDVSRENVQETPGADEE